MVAGSGLNLRYGSLVEYQETRPFRRSCQQRANIWPAAGEAGIAKVQTSSDTYLPVR